MKFMNEVEIFFDKNPLVKVNPLQIFGNLIVIPYIILFNIITCTLFGNDPKWASTIRITVRPNLWKKQSIYSVVFL